MWGMLIYFLADWGGGVGGRPHRAYFRPRILDSKINIFTPNMPFSGYFANNKFYGELPLYFSLIEGYLMAHE